jgi:hypothetical protein
VNELQLIYWIDKFNRIIKVSDHWDNEALQQGGRDATEDKVLSRSLDDFLSDDTTVMLLDTMLKRVRFTGNSITRDYRCDTPVLRRYFEMVLELEDDSVVRVSHYLKGVEPKDVNRNVMFAGRNGHKRCSMCSRILKEGQWIDIDDLPKDQQSIPVYYGLCPDCLEGRWRNKTLNGQSV